MTRGQLGRSARARSGGEGDLSCSHIHTGVNRKLGGGGGGGGGRRRKRKENEKMAEVMRYYFVRLGYKNTGFHL